MAQFRATISGQRGEASRFGSKASGLRVTANGWNAGVRVIARHVDGQDVFTVYRTAGSGYSLATQEIATIIDGQIIPSAVTA